MEGFVPLRCVTSLRPAAIGMAHWTTHLRVRSSCSSSYKPHYALRPLLVPALGQVILGAYLSKVLAESWTDTVRFS